MRPLPGNRSLPHFMGHALSSQVEAIAPIQLALEQLEAAHRLLDRPVDQPQRDCCAARHHVHVRDVSKAAEDAVPGGLHPRTECLDVRLVQCAAKLLCEEPGHRRSCTLRRPANADKHGLKNEA